MLIDETIFETATVRVGRFRCSPDETLFRDSGPIRNHIAVFPRSAVWIRHAGSTWFPADPRVVTTYNAGQEYERAEIARVGDACDWFGVVPESAAVALSGLGVCSGDPERPFASPFTSSDLQLYSHQRAVFTRIARRELDALHAEELVLDILRRVLERSRSESVEHAATGRSRAAHRDLAARARAELARDLSARTDVSTVARTLGASPFHLCRVFRRETGQTMHAFRLDLRVRAALERLEGGGDLSRVALDLGFHSHSHFTSVVHRRTGVTPSALREYLRSAGQQTLRQELPPAMPSPGCLAGTAPHS